MAGDAQLPTAFATGCKAVAYLSAECLTASRQRPHQSRDLPGQVDEKIVSETIPNVLYPNDEPEGGKQLRLAQQYFFASCSLQDIIPLACS